MTTATLPVLPDDVLLEILSYLDPRDVVTGYNVSRQWREVIRQFQLCKRFFFEYENICGVKRRTLMAGSKTRTIDWGALSNTLVAQERRWARAQPVLRWAPTIFNVPPPPWKFGGCGIDVFDDTLLFQRISYVPYDPQSRRRQPEPVRHLYFLDRNTFELKFPAVPVAPGDRVWVIQEPLIGPVLIWTHLSEERYAGGIVPESQYQKIHILLPDDLAAKFGVSASDLPPVPGFQVVAHFFQLHLVPQVMPFTIKVERQDRVLRLLLAHQLFVDHEIHVTELARTDGKSIDRPHPRHITFAKPIAELLAVPDCYDRETDIMPEIAMDDFFIFRTADLVQVYTRETSKFLVCIPPEVKDMFPAAVAYDLQSAIQEIAAASSYSPPRFPTGKPITIQGNMLGSMPGDDLEFESPRAYHRSCAPMGNEDVWTNHTTLPVDTVIAGNDIVIIYDCLAFQVIKDYQSVLHEASNAPDWHRPDVIAKNSVIIGYGARDGAPPFRWTSCGTRLTLVLKDTMVVLDMEKVLLPTSEDSPPIPLTLIYNVPREYGKRAKSVKSTMFHDAIYQAVPLNGVQEAEYRTARAHGRYNPDSAAARHNAKMAPWQEWWSEADGDEYREVRNAPQPPYGLRVVDFGPQD